MELSTSKAGCKVCARTAFHLGCGSLLSSASGHGRQLPQQQLCPLLEQLLQQLRCLHCFIHVHTLLRQDRPRIHGPYGECYADARLGHPILWHLT